MEIMRFRDLGRLEVSRVVFDVSSSPVVGNRCSIASFCIIIKYGYHDPKVYPPFPV